MSLRQCEPQNFFKKESNACFGPHAFQFGIVIGCQIDRVRILHQTAQTHRILKFLERAQRFTRRLDEFRTLHKVEPGIALLRLKRGRVSSLPLLGFTCNLGARNPRLTDLLGYQRCRIRTV